MQTRNKYVMSWTRDIVQELGEVIPGDFLELEHHWADVIDLLFLFNESGCMPQLPDGRMWSSDYKIIASIPKLIELYLEA